MSENKEFLEESIKHFKSLQKRYTREHNGKMCEKVAVALEAMEKQIPKKPNAKRNEAICPNCGQTLTEFFGFIIAIPYCDRCGQAIDWSDEE